MYDPAGSGMYDPAGDASYHITLLHGIGVTDSEGAIIPLARQPALVLFALILGAGAGGGPVTAERLLDLAWEESKRPSSLHALHQAISKLRKIFGPQVIRRLEQIDGYEFVLGKGIRVDWHDFCLLAQTAHGLDATDSRTAALMWADALSVWSPATLGKLPATIEMDRLRKSLIDAYLDALQQQTEVLLHIGDQSRIATSLPSIVREYSDRDRLRELLMIALYRCGRTAESIALYEELREERAQRHLQPSPGIQTAYQRILDNDPAMFQPALAPLTPADQAVHDSGQTDIHSTDTVRMANFLLVTDPHSRDAYSTPADRYCSIRVGLFVTETARLERENVMFASRCVRQAAAEMGISRFLELGTPPPNPWSLAKVADVACPGGGRIVSATADPYLVRHLRSRYGHQPGATYIQGTIRDFERLIQHPAVRDLLGLDLPPDEREPVLIIDEHDINSTSEAFDPHGIYSHLTDQLASGSRLGLTAVSTKGISKVARAELGKVYKGHPYPIAFRTQDEVAALVPDGMQVLPPGVIDTHRILGTSRDEFDHQWHQYSFCAQKP
ncbi:hypothetical protein GCM10010411_76860 [Actinomadura fulvescens]|uniref:Bacterial transcriptional activator domain-containing protein n=1 Tax=Actinomadura fulvescens TaxID=46160 RepID=A0ABP6CXA7_9ACTN